MSWKWKKEVRSCTRVKVLKEKVKTLREFEIGRVLELGRWI